MTFFIVLHAASWRMGGIAERMDGLRGWRLWLLYLIAIFCLVAMWPTGRTAFIYFQFWRLLGREVPCGEGEAR